MADLANLEIPGELAFIYDKLDDWQPVHDGRNVITAVGEVQPMDMGYRLPVDINSHPFSKYTTVYFKDPQWGVKREPLLTPLTNVNGEQLSQHSLRLFKLILRYMCETNMSEKKEKVLADYIVQMGLRHEGLRDEILCQVANQTWQNQSVEQADRLWRLMASCLSVFMPSSTLFKYLLKYVSDVAVNAYKWVCQHKVLQSANLLSQLSRIYPPCFLEWLCIQRKANMALEIKFPDDINKTGHVESWTSGELLGSYLLKQRGIQDNTQGWTVLLQDDVEFYELMGYDYVLDLLSEMEIAPGFPHSKAYFLVSLDRSQERGQHKRHVQEPHNAEQERVLQLVGQLPQMLKRSKPVVSGEEDAFRKPVVGPLHSTMKGMGDLGFSTTSILNQRPTDIVDVVLSDSPMNQRYNQRSAPNGHVPNGMDGADPSAFEDDSADIDLSQTRMNDRYFPGSLLTAEVGDLSTTSRLNARYAKKMANGNDTINSSVSTKNATANNNNVYNKKTTNSNIGARKSAVQDQIRKKQSSISVPADAVSVCSAHSDWSHWVEDVFHSALDEHDDGASEGNPLHARIKGGGQGVPGVSGQQATVPPSLNLGVGLTTPTLSVAPPVMSPAFAFNTQPDALQQLVNQQAMQQQAAQQVALQSLLLQNQQRQQQQALLQTLSQQQQQQQQQHPLAAQVAATQIALQQTELENKLLKQSIERENLKKQLLQLQQPSASPPASGSASGSAAYSAAQAGSLEASYSSAGLVPPPGVLRSPQEEQVPVIGTHGATAGSSSGGPGVAPKRVTFLKSAFETQAEVEREHAAMTSNRAVAFSFPSPVQTDDVTAVSHPGYFSPTLAQGPPDSPSPPPPPPPPFPTEAMSLADQSSEDIYMDGFSVGPSLHTQPQVPYPPPPPPPPPFLTVEQSGLEIDKEKGTFTITDKHGVARTVRVGKVVWPPPMEEAQRKEVNVGKLEINENLAKGIEERIGGKTKWQKPPSPVTQDQPPAVPSKDHQDARPKQRSKLMENSEHSAAMLLLESKLGKPKTPTSESSPASRPLPPVPASESISVQTTDTLKRRKHAPEGQEEEEEWDEVDAIYASTVVRDEPPALSTQPPPPPPPPQRNQAKIVEESFESVVRPDLPPPREEFQPLVEPDVVPPVKSAPMIDYAAFERVVTELFPQNAKHFLMYNKVPWVLHLRKEVFWPSERVESLAVRHLLYCQVVQDVHNNACVRLTKDQRVRMKSMLEGYGVNSGNYLTKELSAQVKKIIIDTAKEWPLYFCRLFPVASDGEYSQVRYLGVSHAGLRLVTRERSLVEDYLSVVEDVRFEDVVDVMLPNTTTVQLNLRTKSVLFQTPRTEQLKDMVDRFCQESEKGNKYVVAVKDYVTRESTLLSFKQGDVIKLVDPDITVQKDWLYGSLNGIVGLFPDQCVRPLALHEVDTSNIVPKLNLPPPTPQSLRRPIRTTGAVTEDRSDTTSLGTMVIDGQLPMMEFAVLHFRQSQSNPDFATPEDVFSVDGGEWTRREQREMVQWTRSPIQASLLNLPASEMNKMALECFVSIMQFMGDYPMGSNQTDYDCVLTILKSCHKYSELRDEVYCQLCRQNTNNRSMKGKSKAKGWRLFALITAYCDCSELLRPYLFKFLETTATDVSRTYNYAAVQCLQNLRKTFKYGGRKNVPLKDEVQALADGRNCRRVPFYYSGSQEQGGLLQVKSCTVVQDCIVDACADLNISDPVEMEEYTFYVRAGDGTFSKLRREEYVLDMTAEFVRKKVPYGLVFQRMVWMYPQSHMDSDLYVDMMFHQCVFDYMDGLMIMWPEGQLTAETMEEIILMAALLHKAGNFTGVPTLKQLDVMVPKTVRQGPTLRPQQWLNRVQEKQREVASHTALSAKALFLETLSRWPLFGSTFFVIKSIPNVTGECMLTVSKNGISFLHKDTHEFLVSHPFREILSTRRYNSDAGISFLDMKIGDLMVQKIVRIETDQGSEISNLISQYMQVINHQHRPSEQL